MPGRQYGGNVAATESGTRAAVVAGVAKGGNLQLRQLALIISRATETSRAIFGASPPSPFDINATLPLSKTTASISPLSPGDFETLAFSLPLQNQFPSRNQSRWPRQSRVLCPPTSSLATPLATVTRLSLPASTMARPDRTWLVLDTNLKMPFSLPFTPGTMTQPLFWGCFGPNTPVVLRCRRASGLGRHPTALSANTPSPRPLPRALHHIQSKPLILLKSVAMATSSAHNSIRITGFG